MAIELLTGIQSTISVPIDEILTLWDAGFEGAEVLQTNRAVDRSHVRRLSESHGRWPAIELVKFRDNERIIGNYQVLEAYALVDGRHRLEAARKLKYQYIRADIGTYRSLEEVVNYAILANAKHGIDSSPKLRGAHALWMWKNHGDTMTIEDIAQIAGVIPRTLKDAIKRDQNKNEEEDAEEEEELAPISEFSLSLYRAIAALRSRSEGLGLFYKDDDVVDVSQYILSLVAELPIGDRGDMRTFIGIVVKILEAFLR